MNEKSKQFIASIEKRSITPHKSTRPNTNNVQSQSSSSSQNQNKNKNK